MPSTTRSAFFNAPDKGQKIGPSQKQSTQVVSSNNTEDVVTISKAEYEILLAAKKKLDDLQNVLNK